MNWILLIALFLIFTEISFIWVTRIRHKRLDSVDALGIQIISAIMGAIGVGVCYFGSRAAELYGIDLLVVQLTELSIGAIIIIIVIVALIVWVVINKYIANRFVVRERR